MSKRYSPEFIEKVVKLWLDKLSLAEVGEELGIPWQHVKTILHRHWPAFKVVAPHWREFQQKVGGPEMRRQLSEHREDIKKLLKEKKLE